MNAAERRREAREDRVILRVGAAMAIFAATGAAGLALAPGGGLKGLEHLAIFAQPSRGRAPALAETRRPQPARLARADVAPDAGEAEPGEPDAAAQGAAPSDAAAAPQGRPRFAAAATPSPPMRTPSRVAAGPDRMAVAAIPRETPPAPMPRRALSPYGEVRRDDTPPSRLEGPAARVALGDWRVYDMVGERALVAGPAGAHWIEAGVDLGAAGVVTRVVATRAGVRVVTSKGAIAPP